MAWIDYQLIWSHTFSSLSIPARVLLPVIAAIAHPLTQDFSLPTAKLAKLSGLSSRSVQKALPELERKGIITMSPQQGKITHLTYVTPAPPAGVPRRRCTPAGDAGVGQTPSIPAPDAPEEERQYPCSEENKSLNNNDAATFKSAAERVTPSVISMCRRLHGSSLVTNILDAMKFLDGEVEKPDAFLIWCCKHQTVPDYKVARHRRQAAERERRREEAIQERRREWHQMEEQFRREQSDPEAQKRIQQEIRKMEDLLT